MEEKIKLLEQEIETLKNEIKELKAKKTAAPSFDVSSFMNLFGSAMNTKNSKYTPRTTRANTGNRQFDREKMTALLEKLRNKNTATATEAPATTDTVVEDAETVEFEPVK